MEHSTPFGLRPRAATLDFIKRFARDYRPLTMGEAKVTILQTSTIEPLGKC